MAHTEEVRVANRKQRRAAGRAGETDQDTTDPSLEQGGQPDGTPAQPFPDHEEDAVFKIQMRVQNAVLGHWKSILVLVGIGLLGVLGFGLWEAHVLEAQQAVQAQLAKLDRKMPKEDPLVRAGFKPAGGDPAVVAKITSTAEGYEAVAQGADGAGAVTAWIRAAAAWQRAGDSARENAAYAAAHAVGASGVVGWSAASAHATVLSGAGDVDGAAAIYRSLADTAAGLLGEQALLNLAELYEESGRTTESLAIYTEFNTKHPESVLKDRVASGLSRVGASQ
jgi:predicted negative regulator of RcsB-dependent stress response